MAKKMYFNIAYLKVKHESAKSILCVFLKGSIAYGNFYFILLCFVSTLY